MKMNAYIYRHKRLEIQKKKMVQLLPKLKQLRKTLLGSNRVSPLYCLKVQKKLDASLVALQKTQDLIIDIEVLPKGLDRKNLLVQLTFLEEKISSVSGLLQRFRKISLEANSIQRELHAEILSRLPVIIKTLQSISEETNLLQEMADQIDYCPN